MANVTLITGGARSGKSAEALRLAKAYKRRVFIATAEAFDDEMRERIARHREQRKGIWETIEEPRELADAVRSVGDSEAAIVIDCLTVWIGNLLHTDPNLRRNAPSCMALLEALRESTCARILVVTNEVGTGIVPESAIARRYRDIAGCLNQRVAALADRVILMVCGQALTVKPSRTTDCFE
jgi:adenosylcobinamide kinase/adenosylcobinamide-phosphate guanylyltransferase